MAFGKRKVSDIEMSYEASPRSPFTKKRKTMPDYSHNKETKKLTYTDKRKREQEYWREKAAQRMDREREMRRKKRQNKKRKKEEEEEEEEEGEEGEGENREADAQRDQTSDIEEDAASPASQLDAATTLEDAQHQSDDDLTEEHVENSEMEGSFVSARTSSDPPYDPAAWRRVDVDAVGSSVGAGGNRVQRPHRAAECEANPTPSPENTLWGKVIWVGEAPVAIGAADHDTPFDVQNITFTRYGRIIEDIWEFLSDCRDDSGDITNTVVFLQWSSFRTAKRDEYYKKRDECYHQLSLAQFLHPRKIRLYPQQHEALHAQSQAAEARVLDACAQDAPKQFSWRPRTCAKTGACGLFDEDKTVHKQLLTCGQDNVQALFAKDKNHLACISANWKQGRPSMDSITIHQERVPDLERFKYRVFIVTKPNSTSLRGREGSVFKVFKIINGSSATDITTEANAINFTNAETGDIGLDTVKTFALDLFERLRRRHDASQVFETLEVGVRLDVGVGTNNAGAKWVFCNKIVRWTAAHASSSTALEPEDRKMIRRAFEQVFQCYVQSGM